MIDTMLSLNSYLGTLTLIFEIAVLAKLLSLIFINNISYKNFILKIRNNILENYKLDVISDKFILIIIFLFSLVSTILTLVYSEIFLQVPCALCWFERIFMYGILFISAQALYYNRPLEQAGILKYIRNFAILGAAVSLYHHILQMTADAFSHLPCPTSGGDCAKRIMFEYGHITFPWMGFVVFSFFIIIILLVKKLKR